MRVDRINKITFGNRIIDAHVHTGIWNKAGNPDELRDYTNDIDIFIKETLPNGDDVEKVIVSNLDCIHHKNKKGNIEFISDEVKGNTDLLKLVNKNSKIIPLAVCQPGYGSVDNIEKLFAQNPESFKGLKFHPECLNIPADSELYDSYMDFAQKRGLPCLFHSGRSETHIYPDGYAALPTEFSKPQQIYNLAKRHPNVPVIMAHMGGEDRENSKIAVDKIIESIRNKDAKLYADISWVDCNNSEKPGIIDAIKRLKHEENGLDRLIFGTDAPLGRFSAEGENGTPPIKAYTNVIDDIKKAIRKAFPQDCEEITNKIFYTNAQKLFFEKTAPKIKHSFLKTLGVTVLFGALLGGLWHIFNKNDFEKNKF